jgi:zinc protease
MRRLLALAALAGAAACATPAEPPAAAVRAASTETVKAPPPAEAASAPAGPVTDGDVTVAAVGAIEVLVQRSPGAELVTATLAIRGGVQDVDARTAGVELLGLRTAASGGTERLDKDAFSRQLTQLGSTVDASAAPNYSLLESKGLRNAWGQTFDLLADVFLRPALPASELQLQRQRQLQELKHEQESPDGALGVLSQKMVFKGTAYANRPSGTEESVKALSAEDVRAHLGRLRVQNRLLVVVVGDVEPSAVLDKVRAAFGPLPPGAPRPPLPGVLSFSQPHLEALARPLPTNFILAGFAGPTWNAPDFASARLASEILLQREFIEVRTKRNLSYAAGARLDTSRPQAMGGLYVSAVDPGAALPVMQGVVQELAQKPLPDKELAGYRSTFLSGFLMGAETTDAQARRLVAAQLLGGDWRLVRTLPERIRQTSAQDVQAFVQKYVRNYQVAVVGDAKKVDLSMLRGGGGP